MNSICLSHVVCHYEKANQPLRNNARTRQLTMSQICCDATACSSNRRAKTWRDPKIMMRQGLGWKDREYRKALIYIEELIFHQTSAKRCSGRARGDLDRAERRGSNNILL